MSGPGTCVACRKGGANCWCAACKQTVYCSKSCQRSHWKLHKPICQRLTDVRALAIAPLLHGKSPEDGTISATRLVSIQIYKQFGKRFNDYLVYESAVKEFLMDPVAMYGWCKLSIRSTCCDQEQDILLENGLDVTISADDRKYSCYFMPADEDEDDADAIDLGLGQRWSQYGKDDTNTPPEAGSGTDEFTFRHPGTVPTDDEKTSHLGHPTALYSPITTKASKHIRAIAFIGKHSEGGEEQGGASTPCSGRLVASYKNQYAIRIDNSRRCLNYDCYEFKPPEGSGRHRSEELKHLPIQPQINRYDSTISCQLPCGVQSIDQPQEVRTICHMKALSGDFFHSRCYRFRVPLKFVTGIRLLQDSREADNATPKPTSKNEEKNNDEEDDTSATQNLWDVAGALVLQVARAPDPKRAPFCVRTVATKNPSFRVIGDWTPNSAASRASRHYVYGAFEELKELAAHLCVVDPHIAALFEHGGGTLKGANLTYSYAPNLDDEQSPETPLVDPQIADLLASSSSLYASKSALNVMNHLSFQDSFVMEDSLGNQPTNTDATNDKDCNKISMLPELAEEDIPENKCFDGSLASAMDCVKDRLVAMAEAGNTEGAIFIAQSLGFAR